MTRSDSGSVLIEAIVAAAIVAGTLGITYRVIGDGEGRGWRADMKDTALLLAQSRLAAVGPEQPVAPGTNFGTEGDLAWRVDVAPYAAAAGGGASTAGQPMLVTVMVMPSAGGAELVTLRSLRLAPPP